jgi:hypothetical protein
MLHEMPPQHVAVVGEAMMLAHAVEWRHCGACAVVPGELDDVQGALPHALR